MIKFSIIFLLYNLFNKCNSFILNHKLNIKKQKINYLLMINDYSTDSYNIDIIQKYNKFFVEDNVGELITKINEDKLSKLFISKDYSEIIGIKLTTSDDIYSKFYLTHSNSIELPGILNKAYEHHIPTNFIDINPSLFSLSGIQNALSIIFNISGYLIPIFFFILLFRGLSDANSFIQPSMSGGPMNIINRNKINDNDLFIIPNVSLSSWV